MKPKYHSLSNPNNYKFPALRYPAEASLGGTMGEPEKKALIEAFEDSCEAYKGFNAAREVEKLEMLFCERYKVKHAIAVNGANTALDLVLKAINIKKNDEIICAGATFHGQHLSVIGSGADLVLSEISESDCCISASNLENILSTRTKAVIATDIHGACADYSALRKVLDVLHLEKNGAKPILISDAARSIGSRDGIASAELCDFTIFSLQSKKLVTALGEGGVILTNNTHYAKILRQYRAFGLGEGWGSNFKISKLQACVAIVQMKRLDEIVEKRNILASDRIARLLPYSDIIKAISPSNRHHTFQFFPLLINEKYSKKRDEIIYHLAMQRSVGAVVANPPSYQYNRWIASKTSRSLPVSEKITDRLLCLAFHHDHTEQDEKYIINSLIEVITKITEDNYDA
ncbi:DegT/DnrJ/EryC1/StrS family aminotransferase [Pseudomonas sp. EA_15y_Pfl2_R67]|uniref:DegT/DnrJ/EryC1/StrS family aminotransferase n=1 Tax=Pseudomonas sp. EA_15y_Pfl2_R67 TaxID=3088687 RepID=UPI0030DD9B56